MNFSWTVGRIIFFVLVPALLLGIQWLLYRRAAGWLIRQHPRARRVLFSLRAAFVVFNLATLALILFRPRFSEIPTWFLYWGVYPYFLWQGSTFAIALVLIGAGLISLPFRGIVAVARVIPPVKEKIATVRATPGFQKYDASRRVFLRRAMYGVTAASFGGNAYGMLVERSRCDLTEETIAIAGLPASLSGFSIVLLSDIHSSLTMRRKEMAEYVRLANGMNGDLVVVAGDFVNGQVDEAHPFAEAFSELKAPHGVYGVMGNHDFYNEDPDRVARIVDDCGVKLLRNDSVVIERNGGRFSLLGVDDVGRNERGTIRLNETLRSAPKDLPRILLCHRPYYLAESAAEAIDLVLSGHTHGGQIVFGRFAGLTFSPAALASPYVWGKYALGKTQMYVSRGIGTVGVPVRFNCPPEITRITLKPA
jgi:uncharacterized protein